jgi:hypothetical protein
MTGRLDKATGVLNDVGWSQPPLAFDHGLLRGVRVATERKFTVTTDCALRAAAEQRTAADHARERSQMARAVPGYNRLP